MHLFGLKQGHIVRLLKLLCGIANAGDFWGTTIITHIKQDLKMSHHNADLIIYFKIGEDTADGLVGSYVGDDVLGGNEKFQCHSKRTLELFYSQPHVWDNLDFIGVSICKIFHKLRRLTLDQTDYTYSQQPSTSRASLDSFVRKRTCSAWLAHSAPDLCRAVNRAVQVTKKTSSERHVPQLNKEVLDASQTADLTLLYGFFERMTLHLSANESASFASSDDESSQLGSFIPLAQAHNQYHALSYTNNSGAASSNLSWRGGSVPSPTPSTKISLSNMTQNASLDSTCRSSCLRTPSRWSRSLRRLHTPLMSAC